MDERIRRLEEKIAHLERHVSEQDKVMLRFAEELATLRRELNAFGERRDSARGGPLHDDEGERPPHY